MTRILLSDKQLNASTYLIEHFLAIIKITNKNSALLQTQLDYSVISKTVEEIRKNMCEYAQEYQIVEKLNSDIYENLLNCYDFPICDLKLIHLCDLLLLFKRAESIKFVSEMNERQALKADEKEFIESAIENELFKHLKDTHKIEEYAPLIIWNRRTPPTSFIYKRNKNTYTYASNNPQPISINRSSLKQMRDKEMMMLKDKSAIVNHLYQRLIQKGFIEPFLSRTQTATKPACFIYDTLMFLGYFSDDYSTYEKQYQINKAKRDCIKELIEFKN